MNIRDPMGRTIVAQLHDLSQLADIIRLLARYPDPTIRSLTHELAVIHDDINTNHHNIIRVLAGLTPKE